MNTILNNLKIRNFLLEKKRELEKIIQKLRSEDPFEDRTRLLDNAASDTEAREEVGHERIEALKNESMQNLAKIKNALSRLGKGKYGQCESCNQPIDKARLEVFPQATLCIVCEQKKESA